MAYEARYVFRPNSGADLGTALEAMKQAATLWQRHGAPKPRLWAVTAGWATTSSPSSSKTRAEYAKVVDPLSAGPEFRRWQANNVKSGAITWVRSNLMRELDLD